MIKVPFQNSQSWAAIATVAAGIPACRRAGLPSPAEETLRQPERVKSFENHTTYHVIPGGRAAALYVRQGCLTPRF